MSPRHIDPKFTQKVIRGGGKTVNLCFQCGTCTGSCPSGRQTAFRTRKLVRQAQLGFPEVLDSEELWMCTTCYTCQERCPRGVEIVDIIMALRNMAVRQGNMAEAHRKAAGYLARFGALVPLGKEPREWRRNVGLDETSPVAQFDETALEQVHRIMDITGFMKLIAGNEDKNGERPTGKGDGKEKKEA